MTDTSQYARLGTSNMVLPPEGPKVYPIQLDFRGSNKAEVDLGPQIEKGFISFLQSIFVDNSDNENPLIIKTEQVGQRVIIPALSQAYLPLLITDSPRVTFETVQEGSLIVGIAMMNTPVHPYIWKVE